jgi:hypothetical protein
VLIRSFILPRAVWELVDPKRVDRVIVEQTRQDIVTRRED